MSGIVLYTAPTANGLKIPIILEALHLDYQLILVDLHAKEQKKPEFLARNPNGRIPMLVDNSTNITVSQSTAIIQYLCDVYDRDHKLSFPVGSQDYYKYLELLIFQVSEAAPIHSQLNHFVNKCKVNDEYAIDRYTWYNKSIYNTIEAYLQANKTNGAYLIGDHLTAADYQFFPSVHDAKKINIDITQWPLVATWYNEMLDLQLVKTAMEKINYKV